LDIYPAREEPIEGVSSDLIFSKVGIENKIKCSMDDLIEKLSNKKPEVLLTMGAGNIDKKVKEIKELYNS
jgi:UDP-N-acetylmuramate--alanine ligase